MLHSSEMPAHAHAMCVSSKAGDGGNPEGKVPAKAAKAAYTNEAADTSMSYDMVLDAGGNHGHNNMMPSLAINFIIAISGGYPARD